MSGLPLPKADIRRIGWHVRKVLTRAGRARSAISVPEGSQRVQSNDVTVSFICSTGCAG
jgi:hypothetical protein